MVHITAKSTIWLPLLLIACFAATVSFAFKLNYLVSSLLFWGGPAVYLSFAARRSALRAALFAVVGTCTVGLIADHLAVANGAWRVSHTVFPFRLFGLLPLEDIIWSVLCIYTIVMVLEVLLAKHHSQARPLSKLPYGLLAVLAVLGIVGHGAIGHASVLRHIPDAYMAAGIVCIVLPAAAFLIRFGQYRSYLAKAALCVVPITFLQELVGSRLHLWVFIGSGYIGRVQLLGVGVPYEELLFYVLFGSVGILAFYVFLFRGVATVDRA